MCVDGMATSTDASPREGGGGGQHHHHHHQHPLTFSSDVQSAIDQVLQSTDPLDAPDFNATDYINQMFPTEQSLSAIDDVIGRMESEIGSIDQHIRCVVRGQSTAGQDGRSSLTEAQLVRAKIVLLLKLFFFCFQIENCFFRFASTGDWPAVWPDQRNQTARRAHGRHGQGDHTRH